MEAVPIRHVKRSRDDNPLGSPARGYLQVGTAACIDHESAARQ